jgi:hypothetical protein
VERVQVQAAAGHVGRLVDAEVRAASVEARREFDTMQSQLENGIDDSSAVVETETRQIAERPE